MRLVARTMLEVAMSEKRRSAGKQKVAGTNDGREAPSRQSELERDRQRDMLALCDVLVNGLFMSRRDGDDLGAWGLDSTRPLGAVDVELSVLKAIGYDMSPHQCSHCGHVIDEEAERAARSYANDLYTSAGEFLRDSWAEYRRLINR
jgi:hypothetical protein